MLPPSNCKTFLDYSCEVFVPYLQSQSRLVARVDLVWDRYFDDSLKGTTRSNRGVGIRWKVTANDFLPKNWMGFLCCIESKAVLFPFLSQNVVSAVSSETLCIATTDENVIANQDVSLSRLMACTLEESDERMFLHALHASENYKSMRHYISLSRKGKKSFSETWKLLPDIFTTFGKLGAVSTPSEIHDHYFKLVEKYFVALYSPSCNTKNLNEAQRILFANGGRSIENIPPTAGALKQLLRRAALQASLWNKCLDKQLKPFHRLDGDGRSPRQDMFLCGVNCLRRLTHVKD